ncbi:MAG: DUF3792 family protein, partial [Oscillospiraceae bacterium]|nr:DUF3792 family protein [Oscillospiraceae bacterium]
MSGILKSRKRGSATVAPRRPIVNAALGTAYGAAVIVALLAVAAAFTASGVLPVPFMPHAVVVTAFCASSVGGKIVARRAPERKLLVALASSALLFALVFTIGGVISGGVSGSPFMV